MASQVQAAGLVPCDGVCSSSSGSCVPCKPCHILVLISTLIKYAVTIIVPILAGLLFLAGGIMMVASGGSEERFKKGRKIFINTALGVLIVLASWAIVNTIMLALGGGDFTPETWWHGVSC
ncbi:MAG: pilin [Patescibacteria group bacterium]